MNTRNTIVTILTLTLVTSSSGDILVFDRITDTVSLNVSPNMGFSATIEAVVKFDPSQVGGGTIYNQWRPSQEDKYLGYNATLNVLQGYYHKTAPSFAGGPVGQSEWLHVAYVYDGSQQRLYVDGQLVGSQLATGDIRDGDTSRQTKIGAFDRSTFWKDTFQNSFIGEIDSLRISSVARYSGDSFVPHTGDFSVDSGALLIFNFKEAHGATGIVDSVSGAIGTFGTGFSGATNPHIRIRGDMDLDGDVDDADFGLAFAAFTGPGGSSTSSADLDNDNDVDDADFGIAFAAFTGPGGGSANVPEPGSVVVLALGGLLVSRRRR